MESIRYEEGLKNLQSMFPDLDNELIKSVIDSCSNNFDTTLNCLLEIASNMREQESAIYNEIKNVENSNKIQKSKLKDLEASCNIGNKNKNIVSILGNSQQSKIEQEYHQKSDNNSNKDSNKDKNKVIDKSKKIEEISNKIPMQEVETKKNSNSIGSKMKNWVTNLFKSNKNSNSNKGSKKDNSKDDGYKKVSMDDD